MRIARLLGEYGLSVVFPADRQIADDEAVSFELPLNLFHMLDQEMLIIIGSER